MSGVEDRIKFLINCLSFGGLYMAAKRSICEAMLNSSYIASMSMERSSSVTCRLQPIVHKYTSPVVCFAIPIFAK